MVSRRRLYLTAIGVFMLAIATPVSALAQGATPVGSPAASPQPLPPMSANATVFAVALNNPRGLKFGKPDQLYVAEGGTGGTASTEGQCEQVAPPVGPYTSGMDASISMVDVNGAVTRIVEGLPSTQTAPTLGSLVSGVADVAWIGDTLYALLTSGGCSHGVADMPNAILRVNADGTTTQVADISAFVMANPTKVVNPADFEPDETPYALVALNGMLYYSLPNHGAVDRVDPNTGTITRVIDISASEGHVVPDALTAGPDGNLYVGTLMTFPAMAGTAKVYKLTPQGELTVYAEGLTSVTGLAFDADGQLYAVETSAPGQSAEAPLVPASGRVMRVSEGGTPEEVASGLMFPTAITAGADGMLYVSNFGYGFPPGSGQIVKIDPNMAIPTGTPTA